MYSELPGKNWGKEIFSAALGAFILLQVGWRELADHWNPHGWFFSDSSKKCMSFHRFCWPPPKKRTGYRHAFHLFPSCVWIAKDKKPSISKQFKAFRGFSSFQYDARVGLSRRFLRYNIPNQVAEDEYCFTAVGGCLDMIEKLLLLVICCYMFRMRCNWILSTSQDSVFRDSESGHHSTGLNMWLQNWPWESYCWFGSLRDSYCRLKYWSNSLLNGSRFPPLEWTNQPELFTLKWWIILSTMFGWKGLFLELLDPSDGLQQVVS